MNKVKTIFSSFFSYENMSFRHEMIETDWKKTKNRMVSVIFKVGSEIRNTHIFYLRPNVDIPLHCK